MKKAILQLLPLLLLAASVFGAESGKAQVALLAPARPHLEEKAVSRTEGPWETDVLISLMNPFLYENTDMDMPQMFAVFEPANEPGDALERRDLLGDIEEIRYLDKKAWSANVALTKKGAHLFALESKPWWDEAAQKYRQFLAKSVVFSGSDDAGWHIPTGLGLEILPLVRPIGLYSPCLFSGVALDDGKPLADVPVTIGHINESGAKPATAWHESMLARTDQNGQFHALLNEPGWWYCAVTIPGEPLKGGDGAMKPVDITSVFWLYVDPAPNQK